MIFQGIAEIQLATWQVQAMPEHACHTCSEKWEDFTFKEIT
jgi:hypothetical protein